MHECEEQNTASPACVLDPTVSVGALAGVGVDEDGADAVEELVVVVA